VRDTTALDYEQRLAQSHSGYHWSILAAFTEDPERQPWLTRFVPGDRHRFTMVPRPVNEGNWHERTRSSTSLRDWWVSARQAEAGRRLRDGGGVMTVLPQLTVMAAAEKRALRGGWPLVSWWFSTKGSYSGWRGFGSRLALAAVDRFVVHSNSEAEYYSTWLRLPRDPFEFVHFQRAAIPIEFEVDRDEPFVFATGSGQRDYRTFFSAIEKSGIRAVVAPGRHAVAGLEVPDRVSMRFDVTKADIFELGQRAVINVIPMNTDGAAAGTVIIVEAMRQRCAIVCTRRSGIEEYLIDGENAVLVSPGNAGELAEAMQWLMADDAERERLAKNAYEFALAHCSDEVAGLRMGEVLDGVLASR